MNALDLAYALGAAVLSPVWARKARGGWAQRLAREVDVAPARAGAKRVVLHAVSVGEVNTLRGLVSLLRPHVDVVVTTTTDTGLARARALFGGEEGCASAGGGAGGGAGLHAVQVARYPLDFSASVARFLDVVRPDAVALVELEVWPNFVGACERRGVPVAVINGRISARSFGRYEKVKRLLRPTFARLALAAAQDEAYARRFAALGVPEGRVRVTDTMKWDSVPLDGADEGGARALARALGVRGDRPLIVGGSTAEGEEALISAAAPEAAQVLCAPRKPERFEEAARAMGSGCVRRSARAAASGASEVGPGEPSPSGRYLLDTIGELRAAYALSDVAVIGRTFAPRRGSDPIEPAALGKPVVCGPDYRNFESVTHALASCGALRVTDAPGLPAVLRELLDSVDLRRTMGEAGRACVRSRRGATARHAGLILEMVGITPARGPVV